MKKINSTFKLTALSAALLSVFGAAIADDTEIAQYSKPDSSISLGVGNWSGDRHQQGIYDDRRESGAFGLFDADIVKRDDATGTWYTLQAQNLGLDSREIRVELLRQGDIGGFLEYNKSPRDNPYTWTTGLRGLGTANQTVSGTAGANAFPKREVTLGTEREMLRAGFYKNLMPGLDFKVDFKNEDKNGTRPWGYGGQPYFLAEPINSTIRQLEATLQYAGTQLQLSGGYYGSWFDQDNGGMVTGRVNGAAASATNPIYLSQPLDNQAHQVFVDGGYNFTPTTRGTFKASYSRATQDEHLPTKDIAGLSLAGGPSSLNGKVDTKLLQFGLTSRPMPKLTVNANLRYNDVDDKTPLRLIVAPGPPAVWNTPQSYTKTSGKLEATYRLPENFSLTGGVDYYKQDRSVPPNGNNNVVGAIVVPYRSELDEITYRLQLRRSLADDLNASVTYLYSDRDGSTRTNNNAGTANGVMQNGYNPIHIADRQRDKIRTNVDWSATDNLSLQFTAEGSKDNYGPNRNPYGLSEGNAWLLGMDASYSFNDDWKLNAWLSQENTRSEQAVASTPVNNINLDDQSSSLGLGLRGKINAKLSMGADLEWTRSVSKFNQSGTFSATIRPLPDIENKVTRLKLNGTYALEKNSDIRVDLIHERWHSDDWTWNFANGSAFCYTGTNASCNGIDGTTVTTKPNQISNLLSIRYIYKFQ